jgi:hypothetical protein
MVDFVNAVTKDAQDTWSEILGPRYQRTRVVLFRDAIDSACGFAQSATGPFYCPSDGKVYLDLSFFNELSQRFGAPGDFAQATSSRTNSVITCRTSRAERAGVARSPGRTRQRIGRARTAGRLLRGHLGSRRSAESAGSARAASSSNLAMPTKRCAPRRRLATIVSRKWPPAA